MLISCVIPAYGSCFLLSRCLSSILTQDGPPAEVIVSDDTRGPEVAEMVSAWSNIYPNLHYREGPRSGNAADNWNAAIAAATGDYVLLVHHDEFFARSDYLTMLAGIVQKGGRPCIAARSATVGALRKSRFHTAVAMADRLGHPTWTLYASNWIGPTAAFAFPRNLDISFDRTIRSLIDVDFYARAISAHGLHVLDDLCVYSGVHVDQISARYNLTALNRQEIKYLENRGIEAGMTQRRIIRSVLWARDIVSGLRPISPRRTQPEK